MNVPKTREEAWDRGIRFGMWFYGILIAIVVLIVVVKCRGDNWAVLPYSNVPATDSFRTNGGPTNWAAEWKNIGTNTSVGGLYAFVGNDAARSNYIFTRLPAWQAWTNSTLVPQQVATESNRVFTITNNIATLTNLLTSNIVFLATVQTNQAAVTTLVLSNQTVIVSRLLNRIGRMITDGYRGD